METTMPSNTQGGSATIYQFPARGRFAAPRASSQAHEQANAVAPRGVRLVSGSAWYHDEAIETERPRMQ
jgi:hypothetical protein